MPPNLSWPGAAVTAGRSPSSKFTFLRMSPPRAPAALAALSEPQRVAVWLVHGFEWTLQETASLLDVSVSTVRTHLERGENKLKQALGVSA